MTRSKKKKILFSLLLLVPVALIIVYLGLKISQKQPDFSVYRQDSWFGPELLPGQPIPRYTAAVKPYTIHIQDKVLQDLKDRLKNAKYANHLKDTHFTYGFSSVYLKKVVEYWLNDYDWRREEAKLMAIPQFQTQIEGLNIHFVHVKPNQRHVRTIVPILVIHGWPGSFFEYYKILNPLTETDSNGLAFEVVAVSIPGFGYSEAPHRKGFTVIDAARIFVKLMERLGHQRFVVHGGDWGSFISRVMAIVYPEKITGVHLLGNWETMLIGGSSSQLFRTFLAAYFPTLYFGSESAQKDYAKSFPLSEKLGIFLSEMGHFHVQSTKPDTLAAALSDSPVGLAAWILEKFSTLTNREYRNREDGGLEEKFTLDELLTNVMIYWTSGNVAASVRFYKENMDNVHQIFGNKIQVPAGTVDTPYELLRAAKALVEPNYANLIRYSEFPRGGHFVAMEEPQLLADDIRQLVRKIQLFEASKKQQNNTLF